MAGGRPAKFETPEEMQLLIDEYFKECTPEIVIIDGIAVKDKSGNVVWKMNYPTITGVSLKLGFESRQSFYDYEKKKEFTYTIKRARLRIENSYEQSLRDRGGAGDIFGLKNFGWSDKHEVETTIKEYRLPDPPSYEDAYDD